MNGNRVIEVLFRSAHAHCDGDSLQHFIGRVSNNVAADDALVVAGRDQFQLLIKFFNTLTMSIKE